MMRLASGLLVATLLTTSMISGTFAKYVTTNSGTDTARVAAFGVSVNIDNDLAAFATNYEADTNFDADEDGTPDTLSVNATTEVVAPGTTGSMEFSITGIPEVATRVSLNFKDTSKAIQLLAGEYTLPAGYYEKDAKTVTTSNPYEPIRFYFGTSYTNVSQCTMTLAELKVAMTDEFTKDYPVNYDFTNGDHTYTLAWAWAFDNTSVNTEADFLDTYLGYQAANGSAQEEVLDFEVTVTQID